MFHFALSLWNWFSELLHTYYLSKMSLYYYVMKVPIVIHTILSQGRYWRIWARMLCYLISSPTPGIYDVLLRRF